MSGAQRLYTPELLALAVELARWPRLQDGTHTGDARSSTCGSTLAIDLNLDRMGRIRSLGMAVRACAIGQASAAIFARHAQGADAGKIERSLAQLEAWLAGGGPAPDWPDVAMIEPARAYPARHGAILLPWRAAMAALSSSPAAG